MNSLWIRVDADEINSIRIAKLSELLDVEPVVALGHFTALCGKVAVHRPTGDISDVPATVLTQWAAWRGDRALFARVISSAIIRDGEIEEWSETMGELLTNRRKDAERKRQERLRLRQEREQLELKAGEEDSPTDEPPSGGVRGLSADGPRKSPISERKRTNANVKSESDDARSLDASHDRNNDVAPASRLDLLMLAAYPDDAPGRSKARRELETTLSEVGARLNSDERARAVDRSHLETVCGYVLGRIRRREIRKPSTANRHVLLRLRDTFAETLSARHSERSPDPPRRGSLELVGAAIAQSSADAPMGGRPELWQLLKESMSLPSHAADADATREAG